VVPLSADPAAALRDQLDLLGVSLAQWEDRDRAVDRAAARKAGSAAVEAIDGMLRHLYMLRGQLTREIRQSDDAAIGGTS
jgi:hypothetical protein